MSDLKHALLIEARAAGFAKMGICRPDAIPRAAERLADFIDAGRHGQMAWMAERMAWRGDPSALWPDAKSVIMLAEPYTPDDDPLAALDRNDRATISVYARNRDYHDLVKKRLKHLGRWLIDQAPDAEIKVFVDTAPVMEKPLAEAAGLGWQGKHTNLLSRDLGNWFFLGAIFTTIDLPPNAPEDGHCGSCTACLDICPTGAFPAPYQLDARRCISYLTIDHKGLVNRELRAPMAIASMAATIVWRSALGTNSPKRPPSCAMPRARNSSAQGWPIWPNSTMPHFAPCLRAARSSASGATGSCVTCYMRLAIPAMRG